MNHQHLPIDAVQTDALLLLRILHRDLRHRRLVSDGRGFHSELVGWVKVGGAA